MDEQQKLKQKIREMQAMMPTLSKREADLIVQVLMWDEDTKIAFMAAKTAFESKIPSE